MILATTLTTILALAGACFITAHRLASKDRANARRAALRARLGFGA